MANRGEPLNIPLKKIVIDFLLVNCVGWPMLILFLVGTPFKRGFYCDDLSIRYPFHESTVPSYVLYVGGLGVNTFVMILIEYLNQPVKRREVRILGITFPYWIYNVYCVIGIFAFGACCSHLPTDVIKYTIGRLRPHFYQVCRPNINCDDPLSKYKYHVDFNCTNPLYMNNKRIMKEMRLSFPSGHSSFSMYTMLFLAIYLQHRMTWDGSKLLRHTLQLLSVLAAVFTASTRVSDYKHHWSDVLAGLFIGTIAACVVTKYFSTLARLKLETEYVPDDVEMTSINGRPIDAQVV